MCSPVSKNRKTGHHRGGTSVDKLALRNESTTSIGMGGQERPEFAFLEDAELVAVCFCCSAASPAIHRLAAVATRKERIVHQHEREMLFAVRGGGRHYDVCCGAMMGRFWTGHEIKVDLDQRVF